ncbi:flagellar motor protein MotB [Cellulomonas sp. SG140]|uniref:OmpA/MotB family protein n=1 Tax=Cellulomonas sp. SG140 TaxID=2976536 RepID=UPI0021E8DF52|nr:flagellar motor protein MotB [Cellulomonas sp. SG140]
MSTPPRRRRKKVDDEEHTNAERWAVSYSDMMTVLMGLFIVLFAISQVDQQKFTALRDSLATGFGQGTVHSSVLESNPGVLDGVSAATNANEVGTAGLVTADKGLGQQASAPQAAGAQPAASSPTTDPKLLLAARAEAAHLEQIRDAIKSELGAVGLSDAVDYKITERGLIIGLVAQDVFFGPESAQLTPTSQRVIDTLSPTLRGITEQVSIEGHANTLPVSGSGKYATNWELSSDRATQVLRRLVESDGMPADRIMAVGFGDARPEVPGADDQALAANRRVDLVVLSSAPDAVRKLLPIVAAGG